MKKFILILLPSFSFATPGVSANKELLYFEIIILALIGLWLGGEYGIKWMIAKLKERFNKETAVENSQPEFE